ncbi:MAG TPA: hypothetical protein EYP03_02525 [Aquificae bacterium]|nr:hypothetical protein [Aquificota bacterium]
MGISDNYLFTKLLNINSNVRSQVERYSIELSTGRKINAPSEAPDDYPYFVKLSDKADKLSQYMQNRNIASTYLSPAENALEQVWDNLQNIRQKALYILNEPDAAAENRNDIKFVLENSTKLYQFENFFVRVEKIRQQKGMGGVLGVGSAKGLIKSEKPNVKFDVKQMIMVIQPL